MKIEHKYVVASGPGWDDCHWLGYRYNAAGFKPDESDSWIVRSVGGRVQSMNVAGWVTDLVRTKDTVWATESLGVIYRRPVTDETGPWQETRVDSGLEGIWGLHDECMFAWGQGKAPTMFHQDGRGWREVPTPGHVVAVHGTRPDLIFAVGLRGLIARWDGSTFVAMESPLSSVLRDVFVVSEDELYAVGTQGEVLRGTVHGWEIVTKHRNPLYCVAKWDGRVWVGAGKDGLFSLQVALQVPSLVLEKDTIHAERMTVGETLLVTAPNAIARPVDHPKWNATFLSTLEKLSAQRPPRWAIGASDDDLDEDDWDEDDDDES
ncbi:MAG: hypothetical protein KC668_27375 [Myxococcales bacterium]|nr:hypothetical protein [Myxococcales bacterium]